MQEYNTINMLACKEVVVNKVRESDNLVVIEAHTKKLKSCPCCGSKHIWVHDHRTQKIKDTQMHGKKCIINLRKTRYNCKCCGKRIDSKTELVAKKMTMTKRLIASIAREFKELYSIKSISRRYSVSTATVTRVLSYLSVERKSLPQVLLIDEFKGDSGSYKYQCSLLDGITHKIIDIVKSRQENILFEYFKNIPKEERDNVEIFVSDMSKTFKNIKNAYFKNAVHIADKYHFVRQVSWSLENVRKRIQKDIQTKLRIYLKRSKSILTKPMQKLNDDQKREAALMLEISEELRLAYGLKESFYQEVLVQKNKEQAQYKVNAWIDICKKSKLREFRSCITAFTNWSDEITNSFDYKHSNGALEGKHTKIKTLKRNSFGMRNFERFRKRIMLLD